MSQTPLPQIRIDGVVTYSPDLSEKEALELIKTHLTNLFQGKIEVLNPDSESYMVSVERHALDQMKSMIVKHEQINQTLLKTCQENDQAFKDLSEQLSKAEEENKRWVRNYDKLLILNQRLQEKLISRNEIIKSLSKRLELKERTRWKTFIKWVKSLWN